MTLIRWHREGFRLYRKHILGGLYHEYSLPLAA
jgi:hypothetical protein